MSSADYWSRHLAKSQAQGVSVYAYAKREGLPVYTLYYWRRRLGLASSRSIGIQDNKFIPLELDHCGGNVHGSNCSLILHCGARLEFLVLPDAHWLAQFLQAMRCGLR